MATRENQGLQIALIIFLMITVGLAISTYVYFREAEEATAAAEAAKQQMTASDLQERSANYQLAALKVMIGYAKHTDDTLNALKAGIPEDDGIKEIAKIKADYDKDMALFDGTIEEDKKNWRSVGEFLLGTVNKRGIDIDVAVAAEKKWMAEKDAEIGNSKKVIDTHIAGQKKAETDVIAVDKKFIDGVTAANAEKTDLEKRLATSLTTQGTEIAARDTIIKDLKEKAKRDRTEVSGLSAKIKDLTNESFERPHGQVTWVNVRSQTCYINLGRVDGLTRQVTFSVYDPNVLTLEVPNAADERKKDEGKEKVRRKASIEVTEILDDHLAECRILDDDLKNPILPGDQLFTPAWRPGQRLQFALVGRMNIDNDKDDDRQKVRNLIESNGGDIVAELTEQGKKSGAIGVNTRFLVIGDRPEEAADDTFRASFNDFLSAAERNGVQQISVRDLVTMMGYKGTDRTVKLGKTGAAEIEKKPADKAFRPRQKPPEPAEKSAF